MGKNSSTRPSVYESDLPLQWNVTYSEPFSKGSGADCTWPQVLWCWYLQIVLDGFLFQLGELYQNIIHKYNKLQGKRPSQWAQNLICAILICLDQVGGIWYLDESAWGEKRSLLHRRGPRLYKTSYGEKKELCFKEVHENSLQSIPSLREGMFVDWRQCGCWTHGTHLGCRFVSIWPE